MKNRILIGLFLLVSANVLSAMDLNDPIVNELLNDVQDFPAASEKSSSPKPNKVKNLLLQIEEMGKDKRKAKKRKLSSPPNEAPLELTSQEEEALRNIDTSKLIQQLQPLVRPDFEPEGHLDSTHFQEYSFDAVTPIDTNVYSADPSSLTESSLLQNNQIQPPQKKQSITSLLEQIENNQPDAQSEDYFRCLGCPAIFYKRDTLYKHLRETHNEWTDPGFCEYSGCNKFFHTNLDCDRINHMNKHTGWSCFNCGVQNFAHYKSLEAHGFHCKKRNESGGLFWCKFDACSAKFRTYADRSEHILQAHKGLFERFQAVPQGETIGEGEEENSVREEEWLNCLDLNQETFGQEYLNTGIESNVQEQPSIDEPDLGSISSTETSAYLADQSSFATATALLLSEDNQKPLQNLPLIPKQSLLPRPSKVADLLSQIEKIGKKPSQETKKRKLELQQEKLSKFTCTLCGTLLQRGSIQRHLEQKHNIRPAIYCCDFPGCARQFSFSSERAVHMDTHGFFTCPSCGKEFDGFEKMKTHSKREHEYYLYRCNYPECTCNFFEFTARANHILETHVQEVKK